jgi:hypothetical protein
VFVCWDHSISTKVLVTATSKNSQDVVSDFPLAFIPKGSKKVSRLYSILVQQRALDENAYNYWLNLQKTTENLGGLFDPLPSAVTGNIRSTSNSREPVLGYFAGGEVQEKRLYINHEELPSHLRTVDRIDCNLDSVRVGEFRNFTNYPVYIFSSYGTPGTIGYTVASGECLDCRESGGVLQRPSFWPR